MDINRVLENLKRLKTTDLKPDSAEKIKEEIVSATQLIGKDLPYFVVPYSFQGLSVISSDDDHITAIHAIAGVGIMGFADQIRIHRSDDVIIYEPIHGLAYLFLAQVNLSEFFGQSKVHLFTNLDTFANSLQNIYEWWKTLEAWKSPPSARLYPDKVEAFHKHIIENGLIGKINMNTLNKLYFQWIRNEIENLHILKNRRSAVSCPDGMKNVPAVLVGAGPSLRHSLSALKDISRSDNMLIIAASTALRVLIPEDIYPHFVIIIEGEKQTHFENIPHLNRLRLLAHLQTFPGHLEYPFRDIFWFNQETSAFASVIATILPDTQPLKFSGNVLSAAFLLASFWGCNPIAFTGMDLAYQAGDKYMKGLDKIEQESDRKPFYDVPGQDNRQLKAPPEFLSYAQNLEIELEQLRRANPEFTAINSSVGGRRIKGTIEMTLEDFAENIPIPDISVDPLLLQFTASWAALTADPLDKILQNHLKTYHCLESLLDKPIASLQEPDNLTKIGEHLKQLPEFNTSVIRLIPWVRHIRSGRNVPETDLSSLKAEVCQILDGFRYKPDKTCYHS